jgi:DNA (cytosine-5)-methyltransferase 1
VRSLLDGWLRDGRLPEFVSDVQQQLPFGRTEPSKVRTPDTPTVIDLFSGAGGFTQGFASVGFRPVWANDFDEACIRTYNENFGHHGVHGDIETIVERPYEFEIPHADVVIGGPPCQGFSLLNKNRRTDERKGLWKAYWTIVQRTAPGVFVMENVPELLASEEFIEFRRTAEAAGFSIVAGVLLAADFGVPQKRRRAIVIGSKLGVPSLPKPTHADPATANALGLRPWLTVRDAIADLRRPVGSEPRPDVGPPLDLHFGRNPTGRSLERYRTVPPGGNRFDLQRIRPDITPGCWKRKTSGGTDLFGRLWWDRPSVTIRTEFYKPEKGRYLHPDQDRPITHREAARIQTFPDTFRFVGSKIEIAKQIGNAVPCLLGAAIAAEVRARLAAHSLKIAM